MVTTVWVIPRKTNYCLSGHHGDCCVFNSKKIRIIILIPRCLNQRFHYMCVCTHACVCTYETVEVYLYLKLEWGYVISDPPINFQSSCNYVVKQATCSSCNENRFFNIYRSPRKWKVSEPSFFGTKYTGWKDATLGIVQQ